MIDWSSIQRVHGARFGDVFNARTVPDAEGDALFHLLTFWRPERRGEPVVYATWGAPGQDLLLFAVTPYFAFEELLERAGMRLADRSLAPLDVVTCTGLDTPFRGFLVASPEEGTFSHEDSGAVRPVHRILLLTPAEVELAERAPREARREFLGLVVASHPEVIGPFHTIVTAEPPPPEN